MFEFYFPHYIINEPNSIIENLLISLVATFIAFLGAFYISSITVRKQKTIELEKQRLLYKNRLTYFSNLITNSLEIVEKQLVNYEKLAAEIKEEPTEIHLLKMNASTDLSRLQRMDSEGIFSSYNEIIKESENKLKDYKNIYNTIDFIYLRVKQAIDSNEKYIGFLHRDQMYIKDKIDGLSDELIKVIKAIESHGCSFKDTVEYNFTTAWQSKYYELVEKQETIGGIETELMLPYAELLQSEHSQKNYFPILYDFTSKSLVRYTHLRRNTNQFAIELENIRSEMKESLEILNEINEKIKLAITNYPNKQE